VSVIAEVIIVPFVDESDKKFYEVAKCCNAMLITGNIRHFPADGTAILPADFLKSF
jgi:hypothetical protein